MASNPDKNLSPSDEKTGSTEESKTPKPESIASGGSPSSANPPCLNFNAFDFSNMAGILNTLETCKLVNKYSVAIIQLLYLFCFVHV
ncbi:unnamed protein product [Eruca vesicaria subsp. sativa]|uniref:Uncharacterized protein n=1 Tax=Eruca vesicaria subsp. sativa TaxID=29727 RepID=A0ABC8JDU5_ERUVS|nr:unnamed protein product [Eruca vesicaria subsp. sativa]